MLPQVVLAGPLSPGVVQEIQTRRTCSIAEVRSLSDFLLMQLSWIYDLNYFASFRQIIGRSMIDAFEQALPKEKQIQEILQATRRFAEQGLVFSRGNKSISGKIFHP